MLNIITMLFQWYTWNPYCTDGLSQWSSVSCIITTRKDPEAATVLVPDFAWRSSKRSNGNGRQHAVDNSVPGNPGEDLIDEEGSDKHRFVRDTVSRRNCP